ncbi:MULTISPECIES: aldo/keto reductase [unclassified Brevundimonas]|uniref:aldo/keto reductase n=1 Tax=unclassified Brevundimonas TaxID=2622653 RepID=UPI0025BC78A9|nr:MULTISPECIES: aldo/keto reductase [unclassified Brevundimonas]
MRSEHSITVDGISIPQLGFGTWQLKGNDARRMVAEALRIGYRHIDTAFIYDNETEVGQGIKDAGIAREDFFLTTKIWVTNLTRDALLKQAEESAERLGSTPDLLLLHWPKPQPELSETIAALNEAKERGLTRAIGLSNYPSALWQKAQDLSAAKLVTNQVEYHPLLTINALKTKAAELGASLTAWSPLARGKVLDEPVVQEIARKYGKTAGQVTLRWIIQQGLIAIPKTANEARARENFDIFDFALTEDEIARMAALANDFRVGDHLDPAFQWDAD